MVDEEGYDREWRREVGGVLKLLNTRSIASSSTAERPAVNRMVEGSNPSSRAKIPNNLKGLQDHERFLDRLRSYRRLRTPILWSQGRFEFLECQVESIQ
jgi:hypothetical protein